ncbi:MAG: protein-L-isoaspartate(D-aspartate) O-methyltransferase [Deltaproteobacteria bacterium]|nr:protein-L-isoaspartate(D-aspartate) O-methyltransferase [Deltaproteobacteria bacterium]
MKKALFLWLALTLVLLAHPAPAEAGGDKDEAFRQARLELVARHIEAGGIKDPAVLQAMRTVPRHLFVPPVLQSWAYFDQPLPIGYGQTISQPYVVAYMTEILGLKGEEKVLEIGAGSGYQAAVLAEIVTEVYSIEIIPELYAQAKERLTNLGYDKVELKAADGYYGWPKKAPFDAIIVTCAAAHIPPPLIKQLKRGGRMVIPVGPPMFIQTIVLVKKEMDGQVKTTSLLPVTFVPLVREE